MFRGCPALTAPTPEEIYEQEDMTRREDERLALKFGVKADYAEWEINEVLDELAAEDDARS
jgi:hypothetical protein